MEVLRIEDGVEHYASCPGHLQRAGRRDRSASWSVNEFTGWHNCFSCGFSGNFVHLVSYLLEVDPESAGEWIRERGGIERAKALLQARETPKAVDTTRVINEASLALWDTPPAEVLETRRITREAAQAYGVLWDAKREMWITTVRDPDRHHLLGWQEKNARHFKNVPYGLQKSTTLFGLDLVDRRFFKHLILVESPLDCARILSAGVAGAVSSYGVGVSAAQLDLLLDRTDDLILALDNDEAGIPKAEEIRREWRGRGMRIRFFSYDHAPDCKDPGDMTDDQIRQGVADAHAGIITRA